MVGIRVLARFIILSCGRSRGRWVRGEGRSGRSQGGSFWQGEKEGVVADNDRELFGWNKTVGKVVEDFRIEGGVEGS